MEDIKGKEKLLRRLEEISQAAQKTGKVRALLGFGSVAQVERMDAYSDLDFLVIAKKGYKWELIEDLGWMTSIAPVGYFYLFTSDGYRLFFKDGIFCDFGIVEEEEAKTIPHGEGRVIWCEDDFDQRICRSTAQGNGGEIDLERAVGETLTNLYIGLCRFARGEKLAAARCIQNLALDHLLACSHLINKETVYYKDPFQNERRYEKRFPSLARSLPKMIQGYEKSPESALAILEFMESTFEINPYMKELIKNLANDLIHKRTGSIVNHPFMA